MNGEIIYDIAQTSSPAFPWIGVVLTVVLSSAASGVYLILRHYRFRRLAFVYGAWIVLSFIAALGATFGIYRYDFLEFEENRQWHKTGNYDTVEGRCVLFNHDIEDFDLQGKLAFKIDDTVFEYGLYSRNYQLTSEVVNCAAESGHRICVDFRDRLILRMVKKTCPGGALGPRGNRNRELGGHNTDIGKLGKDSTLKPTRLDNGVRLSVTRQ